MYNESQIKYKNSNITLIDDNEDIAKIDITTSKGHIFRDKALMISDDQNGEDCTVLVSNLTDLEKIKLFDALDASLHDTTETNAYMTDKIITLEGQIDDLAESTDSPTEQTAFDGEYDFYNK